MSANGRHNADGILIAALAAGRTQRDAAEAAGVSEKTVQRRMADESFRAEIATARGQLVDTAVGRAASSPTEAVETLLALMRSAESESVRLGAARAVVSVNAQRKRDPIADAIHGVGMITPRDAENVFGRFLDIALERIPVPAQRAFLEQVKAVGHGRR